MYTCVRVYVCAHVRVGRVFVWGGLLYVFGCISLSLSRLFFRLLSLCVCVCVLYMRTYINNEYKDAVAHIEGIQGSVHNY